jgi:hypothetical protein
MSGFTGAGMGKAGTESRGRDVATHSIIMGSINGISRDAFREIEPELVACFDSVRWNDNAVIIRSERFHDQVRAVFQKMAERIAEGNFGSLLYVGNNRVACIYFGPGRFVAKEYREPTPPAWWGTTRS